MALPEVSEKCAQQSVEAVSPGGVALRQLITQEVGKLRALGQRLKLSLD